MKSNWQTDFFRGVAVELWRRLMTPEQSRAEVDFLERVLNARSGARFLDIPCGTGRHAIEFAKRGYVMTGLDSSEESISQARNEANVPIGWILADMCELPWNSEFDGVYCFGNSFGYLDLVKAREFLTAIAKALKLGARFVMETGMAAESILPGLVKTRWYRAGDIFMLSENQYHPADGRLDINYTFIQNGEVNTLPSASYVFTVAEICRMHAKAGLAVVELMGSMTGEAFQIGSPRLLVISEKR